MRAWVWYLGAAFAVTAGLADTALPDHSRAPEAAVSAQRPAPPAPPCVRPPLRPYAGIMASTRPWGGSYHLPVVRVHDLWGHPYQMPLLGMQDLPPRWYSGPSLSDPFVGHDR